jgi:hypothetical protein
MKEEVEDVKKVHACSPGFGAVVNCILPMVNVKDHYESRTVSMSGVNASTSPGSGAFTIYHGRRWKAKMDIPAGMELYGNYGSAYFRTRPNYGPVPFNDDYKTIDKLLKKYRTIIAQYQHDHHEHQPLSDWRMDLLEMLQSMSAIWDDSRTMNAIPKTNDLGAIDWLLDRGRGSGFQHFNTSIRSVEWLEANGRCMTNMYEGTSTIPHAGRGAFASRFIPKGTIVAPAPVIQIPDRDVFTVYAEMTTDVAKSNGKKTSKPLPDHTKPIHQQLLLNYCFGHRDSSLLLCPYGLLTSLINHDGRNPNTEIQWANDDHMAHPEWRNQSIEVWKLEEKAGLSFDFIALRDIEPNEEITVDYGREWSLAWQRHVKRFKILPNYIPAFELNESEGMILPTHDEMRFENIGVRLFCREDNLRWAGVVDRIMTRLTTKNKDVDWLNNRVFPCHIIQRSTNTDGLPSYLVEVFERWDGRSNKRTINREVFLAVAFDLPREAFYFADEVYRRPHHQPWSFRHDMRVPDDIFPEAWMDRKSNHMSYQYVR